MCFHYTEATSLQQPISLLVLRQGGRCRGVITGEGPEALYILKKMIPLHVTRLNQSRARENIMHDLSSGLLQIHQRDVKSYH